jgi:hypothetical protein
MHLALITIESVANQHDDMLLKESEMYKLSLESIVDKYVPKEDLIIVNGTPSPRLCILLIAKDAPKIPRLYKTAIM